MKKILFGLVLFAFSLCMYGSPLSAAESFVEKMRQHAGHALSSDEIRQVLVGNTVVRERLSKWGKWYKIYTYYPTPNMRELGYTNGLDSFEGPWSAKPGGVYCRRRKMGGWVVFPISASSSKKVTLK